MRGERFSCPRQGRPKAQDEDFSFYLSRREECHNGVCVCLPVHREHTETFHSFPKEAKSSPMEGMLSF